MQKLINVLFILSIVLSASTLNAKPPRDGYEKLDLLAQVLARIEQSYVETVDREAIIDGAIRGILKSLDPHSSYLSAKENREFKSQLDGAYVGIGAEMGVQDNKLVVVMPFWRGPAQKAGLKAGDIILSIDDESVEQLSLDDLLGKIRGEAGSIVKFVVSRPGELKPRNFLIERGAVQLETLVSRLVERDFGLIHLRSFGQASTQKVKQAIAQLERNNAAPLRGLILDLRGNPGGYLQEGVELTRLFLHSGLIVSVKGRNDKLIESHSAAPTGASYDIPLVVLIDEGSASASEIVAAALQDHHRAMIVGQRSFGKGSVQSIFTLPDGSSVKLTVAKYYSPANRCIQALGVEPDITVEKTAVSAKSRAGIRERDLKGSLKASDDIAAEDADFLIHDLQEFTALNQLKALDFAKRAKQ
ncbi:MAG: S41 family peptidase [Bradymonadales bacterium]|jgi:carboxyl-terminal processing protease